MSLRQIQVRAPISDRSKIDEICQALGVEGPIFAGEAEGEAYFCIFTVKSGETPSVLHALEKGLGDPESHGYSAVVLPVEATVPRRKTESKQDRERPAREELLEDASELARVDRNFLVFVLLSSMIATIGLLADDVAVVIAAMVITPLLGPVLSMSLGIVMADVELLKRGAYAEALGLALSFLAAYCVTSALPGYAPELSQQVLARTHPNLFHLVLALGSGFAGAVALAGGTSTTLVGVTVAVALLTPTAVVGIGLASGDLTLVSGASLLVLANLTGAVLSGVVAFRYKGIHPGNWRRERAANRRTRPLIAAVVATLLIIGVPLGRVTVTTIREAQIRGSVGEIAGSVVPGFGWVLSSLGVDASTVPPRVFIEVKAPVRPDAATVDRFRDAVFSLIPHRVQLVVTVIPVDVWTAPVPAVRRTGVTDGGL